MGGWHYIKFGNIVNTKVMCVKVYVVVYDFCVRLLFREKEMGTLSVISAKTTPKEVPRAAGSGYKDTPSL